MCTYWFSLPCMCKLRASLAEGRRGCATSVSSSGTRHAAHDPHSCVLSWRLLPRAATPGSREQKRWVNSTSTWCLSITSSRSSSGSILCAWGMLPLSFSLVLFVNTRFDRFFVWFVRVHTRAGQNNSLLSQLHAPLELAHVHCLLVVNLYLCCHG